MFPQHYDASRRQQVRAGTTPESSMVAAEKRIDEPAILKFPILDCRASDTRSLTPGVAVPRRKHRPAPNQETLWPTTVDPDVLAYAESVKRDFRDPVVPEKDRLLLQNTLDLRKFYCDWLLPEHERRVSAGKMASGTLSKYRQALNYWERHSRPDDWPPERPWQGVPIGAITALYLAWVLSRLQQVTSEATARSTWNHLRAIFNHAVKVRALDFAPCPQRDKPAGQIVEVYKPEQIETAYRSLADYVDLQVAFVVALNVGTRTVDTFLLRWEGVNWDAERPTISFRSKKTGKTQTIPLAPITVEQLRRLPSYGRDSFLFPNRTSPAAKDPERSKPALRRRTLIRTLFGHAGIHFPKPFQVARSTCNTRLNSTPGFNGAGVFVLGHGLTLNSKSYMDPSDFIFQAVNAVKQPACFSAF